MSKYNNFTSYINQPMVLTSLAVALRIFSNPLGNVFQKTLIQKNNHPLVINFLTFLLLSILCLFPAIQVDWLSLPASFWYFCLLAGLTGATGNGFLVRALENGDLSVLGPINSYKSVVGMIAGIFLLGEIPNIWGVVGVGLIIYGSYFVLDTMKERFSFSLFKRKDIQYRIWAMILTAIEAIFIKKIILYSSTMVSFIVWCWFGAIFSFLLLCISRPSYGYAVYTWGKAGILYYFFLVVCIGTMQYTTNYIFDHMEVGYALALFQLSTIVSILLGYRIFKETDIQKKLVGAFIMIIGSILIILLK
ncbi:MAG: EamA family transporter [Tannerellaceae bacterium]|nr:EamA family transporter [Tannerellaceae bacterium]